MPTSSIQTGKVVRRERLERMVDLLREAGPQGLTLRVLAEGLEASEKTVERARTQLKAQGAELEERREGGILRLSLRRGPDWEERVSTEARLALHLASGALTQASPTFLEDELASVERLITAHMTPRELALFETLKRSVKVQGGVQDAAPLGDVLVPLLEALEKGLELEVEYRGAGKAQATRRRVVPHCVTLDIFSGGSFLSVWDPEARLPKHMRLCRIQGARVGSRRGLVGDRGAMERAVKFQIGGWGGGEAPWTVRARIHGQSWIRALEDAEPTLEGFELRRTPDPEVAEIRFQANRVEGAARWLLQFGASAEVLAPEALRAHVRAALETALGRYGAPSDEGPED